MEPEQKDPLLELGRLLKAFDERHGSSTQTTLVIERGERTHRVQLGPKTGYLPQWTGKQLFPPPEPGQTKLTVGPNRRLMYK